MAANNLGGEYKSLGGDRALKSIMVIESDFEFSGNNSATNHHRVGGTRDIVSSRKVAHTHV